MTDELPKGAASAGPGHELTPAERSGIDKASPNPTETAKLDGRPTGFEKPAASEFKPTAEGPHVATVEKSPAIAGAAAAPAFDPAKPGEDAAKRAAATPVRDPNLVGALPHRTVAQHERAEHAEAAEAAKYRTVQAPRPAVESTMVQATPQAVYNELDANAGKVPSQAQVIAAVARKL